ncbi:MAG: DUF2497 domain-containing protein [Deltaproteobacteria bacterium]|nr:DUF2497 domain-containing protein [Deltaproteobacteria bacterium]
MAKRSENQNRKRKVLVADESVTIQKLVHLTFAGTSYEIVIASDGHDALAKAKGLKPDFILADCQLAQLDGFQLCSSVRKELGLSATKVILLKAANDKDANSKAIEARADELMSKPFDAKTLMQAIERLNSEEENSTVVKAAPAADEEVTQRAPAAVSIEDEVTRTEKISNTAARRIMDPAVNHFISDTQTSSPFRGASPEANLDPLAQAQIKEWIDANLPSLAEKMIKDEIARLVASRN